MMKSVRRRPAAAAVAVMFSVVVSILSNFGLLLLHSLAVVLPTSNPNPDNKPSYDVAISLSEESTSFMAPVANNNAHNSNNSSNDWIRTRHEHFSSWFENGTGKLKIDADAKGPILDFVIAGFPKCGTTTLEANLGYYAPMPIADVCVPVHQAVYYAYKNWPNSHGQEKILRGTKCPAYIYSMKEISKYLPKSKTIIGIRHPVLWFQSFWNMLAGNDKRYGKVSPYNKTQPRAPREENAIIDAPEVNSCVHVSSGVSRCLGQLWWQDAAYCPRTPVFGADSLLWRSQHSQSSSSQSHFSVRTNRTQRGVCLGGSRQLSGNTTISQTRSLCFQSWPKQNNMETQSLGYMSCGI
jgi:hypothetical protein